MRKKIYIIIAIVLLSVMTGCNKKEEKPKDKIETVSNIELGKKQYIEQLKKIPIDGTDDYLFISKKVKWEVPDHGKDTTVSFTIMIPYILHVDGEDYNGIYYLASYETEAEDLNPKYIIEITNLTSNYETEVLITKKRI